EPHEYAGATVKPILHFSSFLLERGVRASPDPPSECPLSAGENHAPSVSPAQARWALFACRPPPLHRSTTSGRRSHGKLIEGEAALPRDRRRPLRPVQAAEREALL